MYKTKAFGLLFLMFTFAGSIFAQQASEIMQLLQPDDPTILVPVAVPNSVTTTIDGENKNFTFVNNIDGSISITDEQGVQFNVTLTGTGKIAQQTMPNGERVTMNYKTLNGTSQLLGLHISGDNFTTDNLMLSSVADGPFPRGGGGGACGDAAERAAVANSAVVINCVGGFGAGCYASLAAAAYFNYKMYQACRPSAPTS